MTRNIQVIKVEDRKVEIRILGVHFVFTYDGNVMRMSKYKPDAQVYDPNALRVPAGLFNKACQQAAAILKGRHKKQATALEK